MESNDTAQHNAQATGNQAWSTPNEDASGEDIWGNERQQERQRHLTPNEPGGIQTYQAMHDNAPSLFQADASTSYSGLGEEANIWEEGRTTDPSPQPASRTGVGRVPTVLRPGIPHHETGNAVDSHSTDTVQRIPTVLRPAGGAMRPETNPFKRRPVGVSIDNSGNAMGKGTALPTPSHAPPLPPPPSSSSTVDTDTSSLSLSHLSLVESHSNPWQPVLGEKKEPWVPSTSHIPETAEPDLGSSAWASNAQSRQPSPGLALGPSQVMPQPSDNEGAVWERDDNDKITALQQSVVAPSQEPLGENPAWDELEGLGNTAAHAPAVPAMTTASLGDDWNLIDMERPHQTLSRQSTWENFADAEEGLPLNAPIQPTLGASPEQTPALPPRSGQAVPPPQPPRPVSNAETYQIRNVSWHDPLAQQSRRTSPVLVQNANGPCPLVALVNALTLTTPADINGTALVETLRSREQVSLGLLLDAVFDELIRRSDPDVELPDVTELYEFLKGLHTGMNVNPRFVPTPEVTASFKRTSLVHVHPTQRGDLIPGTFEATREMSLYATFSIPLYHGWLPAKDDPACEAFARQAASYEDAQNLLFREEELELKLSSASHRGLSEQEQQVYQDILTIKSFLSISATQLTAYGLEVVTKAIGPGSIAILFRNDHFSTLYRHPHTLQLFSLVTDAGYAGHEEVVWESLVDVNGERAEFFSGDYRLVGGVGHGGQEVPLGRATRGQAPNFQHSAGGMGNYGDQGSGASAPGSRPLTIGHGQDISDDPLSLSAEQEDRDLALALQLQEEEDERHRSEQERRDRESRLSEQFIEQQVREQPVGSRDGSSGRRASRASLNSGRASGRRGSSNIHLPSTTSSTSAIPSPVRGAAPASNGVGMQPVRSLLPPRTQPTTARANAESDDAPPSYEQAAQQDQYNPPEGHPSHAASSPRRENAAPTGAGRRSGGNIPVYAGVGIPIYAGAGAANRLRTGMPPPGVAGTAGSGRDRDCVIM